MTDSSWYKDAIFYELRVRSFFDGNDDGVGDFCGLAQKLDYLQDLGVTTLWLLPFYPSPMRDDGYDIASYEEVNPAVGTLREFRDFLDEAHARGLRVVTELVLNHTSDQHPWFQRARRAAPGSRERGYYVWSDTPDRYRDARIIFTDYESSNWTWDPVAKSYFWHRFFSHQPDLNFASPAVRRSMFRVVDFWLKMGVDGLRLDAVPYLFEREGTSCENLPETHALLQQLRAHVDHRYPGRMLLAEANQWPEDAVTYFGQGDECHMAFHFPIMPRLYMALRMEDSFPVLDIIEQTPAIPPTAQWALFLRNHDELTLEMVTDEERDYMVHAYASDPRARVNLGIRRRLAPLLENNRRRIELLNALLFSLPGTPVLYYGDEIGMGDNIYLGDRDSVRTPMQWSPDRNAGFSRANPQQLVLPPIVDPEYHFETVNVETQQRNPSSLLWWTKRLIAMRKQHRSFGRGSFEPLSPTNRKILAFLRRDADEVILVVANLSRFAQPVELDLRAFVGRVPVELFGRVRFPPIGPANYQLSLGPHSFLWFRLDRPGRPGTANGEPHEIAVLEARGAWTALLRPDRSRCVQLEAPVAALLPRLRWFLGKARGLKGVRFADLIALGSNGGPQLLLAEVSYAEGEGETYALVLGLAARGEIPVARAIVRSRGGSPSGLVLEQGDDPATAARLHEIVVERRHIAGASLELVGVPTDAMRELRNVPLAARRLGGDQSNSCFVLGDRILCKLLRKVEAGPSVELEALRHLAGGQLEARVPALLGHVALRRRGVGESTLAIFERFVPNQGDGWRLAVDHARRFYEQVLVGHFAPRDLPELSERIVTLVGAKLPAAHVDLFGGFPGQLELLGRRTAELHAALAQPSDDGAFGVESFGALARRSSYQSARNLARHTIDLMRERSHSLPDRVRRKASAVVERERQIHARLRRWLDRTDYGRRIRVHGDYHLGQVLTVANDFVIIDFEGEPSRPLADRRRKRSPIADLAGLVRSIHYAAFGVLAGDVPGSEVRPEDRRLLEPWALAWYRWCASRFLSGYLAVPGVSGLLPATADELDALLDLHLLEKALYEVAYELNSRPTWIGVPLRGVLDQLGTLPHVPL